MIVATVSLNKEIFMRSVIKFVLQVLFTQMGPYCRCEYVQGLVDIFDMQYGDLVGNAAAAAAARETPPRIGK